DFLAGFGHVDQQRMAANSVVEGTALAATRCPNDGQPGLWDDCRDQHTDGDLTKRKLMPALYRLAYDRRLSAGFAIVGSSRTAMTDEQFREKMLEAVK